jgi:hypothetical protein
VEEENETNEVKKTIKGKWKTKVEKKEKTVNNNRVQKSSR